MKDTLPSAGAPGVPLHRGERKQVASRLARRNRFLVLGAFCFQFACSGGQRGSAPPGFNPERPDVVYQAATADAGAGGSATEVPADASATTGDAGQDPAEDTDAGPDVILPNADPYCGDGRWDEATEECEGLEPGYQGCTRIGFVSGALKCRTDCTWDARDCRGTESCTDGIDNDGDTHADCDDTDCSRTCANPCAHPSLLVPGNTLSGSLVGRSSATATSCGDDPEPYLAFEIDATTTGKLDVTLSTFAPLTLSIRSDCSAVASESLCLFPTRTTLDVVAGQRLFAIVSGRPDDLGADFQIQATARQRACGDGVRDANDEPGPEGSPAEECDDLNVVDGDGCSSSCKLEATEIDGENDSIEAADPVNLRDEWVAQIRPRGDVDHFIVELIPPQTSLVVSTLNLGDGACAFNLQDTTVQILDTVENGYELLAAADDGGDGRCASAVASGLSPGVYTVVVSASVAAVPDTFPYRLGLFAGECGDGSATPGEECDDGNREGGDGCSPACTTE